MCDTQPTSHPVFLPSSHVYYISFQQPQIKKHGTHFLGNSGCKTFPDGWRNLLQDSLHFLLCLHTYITNTSREHVYTSAYTCTYSKLNRNAYILIGLMESSEKCVNAQLCEAWMQRHSSNTVCRQTERGGCYRNEIPQQGVPGGVYGEESQHCRYTLIHACAKAPTLEYTLKLINTYITHTNM